MRRIIATLATTGAIIAASAAPAGAQGPGQSKARLAYIKAVAISKMNLPYTFGGGHGSFLPSPGYDCSGYVSAILHAAGVLTTPMNSTALESWAAPGPGQHVTVYATAGHAWIGFSGLGHWLRADTSPWGDGLRGPHVRATKRPTRGFVARHAPGM
jgi:hypothetical protein